MSSIVLEPTVLQWARKRAGLDPAALALKVIGKGGTPEKVREWEKTGELSFRHAELIAEKTHTPVGYLFLQFPPVEKLPINDFRTIGDAPCPVTQNLLDIIYEAQRRQEWYRNYLIESGGPPLSFVGKISIDTQVEQAAKDICDIFKIGPRLSTTSQDWKANLLLHVEALEERGVLVMRSGSLGPTRKLSVEDFRGFALSDAYAPIIFINTSDSQGAQLFTLAHELVHICIGESAVSNLKSTYAPAHRVESFCNAVAAEMLLPIKELIAGWNEQANVNAQIQKFSARYKVSTLVVIRRAKDAGFLTQSSFNVRFRSEFKKLRALNKGKKPTFYNTRNARVGNRMVRAIIGSTLEGKTLYRDAMHLLGLKSANTFHTFAKKIGYSSN